MEDTLGALMTTIRQHLSKILILVLMEDTLGDDEQAAFAVNHIILILVLMEDTLGEQNLRILYFRGFDNNKTY